MMSTKRVVEVILAHRHDLTYDEVMTAIRRKKGASEGLLTGGAAARLVAAEYGISIRLERPSPKTYLDQVVGGLNDVTVCGRVLLVGKPKIFRQASKDGQLARLLIADRTGVLKVVLWNDKAEPSTRIQPRLLVRILHGYARESRDGDTELHVGERGGVQVTPSDLEEKDFPSITELCRNIADLNDGLRRVQVKGVIKALHPASSFRRRNGTQGRVLRALLEDKTGKLPIVFWGTKAEEAAKLTEGESILLINAKVKMSRYNDGLELHIGDFSSVEALASP
jgi:replication factor A1